MDEAIRFFVEQGSYGLMIGALVAAGLGVPLPEDIVMISGAILAQRGITDLGTTVAAIALGVFLGDSALFVLARKLGPAIYEWRFVKRVMPEARRRWVEDKIARYGGLVVFCARHVAGFRGPTFAIAASHGMSYPTFIFWDLLALAISLPLWMGLGWFFGSSMDRLVEYTESAEIAITAGVLALIVFLIAGHYVVRAIRRRMEARVARGAPPQPRASSDPA
jgi:membrane protein DedA with SNARE-associated domain